MSHYQPYPTYVQPPYLYGIDYTAQYGPAPSQLESSTHSGSYAAGSGQRAQAVSETVRQLLLSNPIPESFLGVSRKVPQQNGDAFSLAPREERSIPENPDQILSSLMQQLFIRPMGDAKGTLSSGTPKQALAGLEDLENASHMVAYLGIDRDILESALRRAKQQVVTSNPFSSAQEYTSPIELKLLDVAVVDYKEGMGEHIAST